MNVAHGVATGRGHGKVILLGEHSVVHGRPALAAGLASGSIATAEPAAEDSLTVEPWGVRVRVTAEEHDAERELLRRAFEVACQQCSSQRQALSVRATMEIPSGAGLGSSAALSVAVLRAMDAASRHTRSESELLAASVAWERVFHGNPSGVDSAMAIGGGLARYVRTAAGPELTRVLVARTLHLVIGNSAEHGSTKLMVARVAEHLAREPRKTEDMFDRIATLVNEAQRALETGELAQLGPLLDENQRWLDALGLSTPKLDRMCQLARAAGALGAKLTGGGGGGCMLALARDAQAGQSIVQAFSDAGYAAFVVEVSP